MRASRRSIYAGLRAPGPSCLMAYVPSEPVHFRMGVPLTKQYCIRIFGWSAENQRQLLSTTIIEAADYFDAFDAARRSWKTTPSAMSFDVQVV